jgi:predicted Zn-dependent protease
LRSRRATLALALVLALGCKTAPLADIETGEQPSLESDEAGFWMEMERAEKDISTSGNRIRDPELDAYLKGVICRVAPDYCSATRVYVMRQPEFNASMAPNGMMVVWSGLLIRVQNEAQLAAVLAHEVGHYQRRHTLAIFRRARKTTNALMAITLLAGGVVPGAADAAVLIGMGTLMAHSREQEAEADQIGIERMAKAGYDPREVAEIWQGVLREMRADPRLRVPFLASHPAEETRLRKMAEEAQRLLTPENARGTRTAEFDDAVRRLRVMLLGDEVAMRKHKRSEVVIARLLEAELITPAEAAFYRGELFRVRGEKGDDERAVAQYREAVAGVAPVPLAYRNLGLVLRRSGDRAGARESFQRYVELAPDANDRAMVDAYIRELTP